MILLVALIVLVLVAYRLRARPSAKVAGDVDLVTEDPCPEYSDEEVWSLGFGSRADFRAAEISSFQESAHEGRSVSESEWRRYHGLPLHQPTPKTCGTRTRPRMRQRSRSRRAPRRARVSAASRTSAKAGSADPPGPRHPRPRCSALHSFGGAR
jgi:hypothetical protein